MAKAQITQTFDAEGNVRSLVMSVDCDVLDSPEAMDEVVKRAVILYHCVEAEGDE